MIDLMKLTDRGVDEKILEIRRNLGTDLFLPVHHYQRDEIVQFADYTGDSLELSRVSAATEAKYIVFCGVYFMAEIARVLASDDKYVFIPNKSAGCPLADFGYAEDIEFVWDILQSVHPGEYIPVTYANSHVDVKAFCGRNGGLVCTSSNVQRVFQWIFNKEKRVFFMPDKNLGVNTASGLGMEKDLAVVDRYFQGAVDELEGKKIIIWNGYCIIHTVFTFEHVQFWKKRDKDINIIVHPECEPDVVKASDYNGSTSYIKRVIEKAEEGSKWVIGTEYNFVNRLKMSNRSKFIEPLDRSVCANMSKNRRRDLLKVLIDIEYGDYSNQVIVSPEITVDARVAIDRMLKLN